MSQYTTDTYPIIEYNASTYPPASELVTVRKDLAAPFPQGFYGKKNILVADAGSPAFLSIPITTPKVTPVVSLDNLKYISRFETSSNSTPNEKKGPYLCWISSVPGGNPILRQNFVVMVSRSGRTGKLYMTTDPNIHNGVYDNIEGSGLSGDQRQEILYMGSDYGLKFLNIAIVDLNLYELYKNAMPNPGSARFAELITTDDNAKIRCNEFRFYLNHPPSVTSSAFAEVTTNFPSFAGAPGGKSGANIAGTYDTAGTPRPTAGKTSSKDNNTPFKLVAPPNNNWFCRFVLDDKRRDMQTTAGGFLGALSLAAENALLEITIKPPAVPGRNLAGAIGNISLENMFKPFHELAGFLPLEIEFTTNAQRANVPGEGGSSSETTRTANAWAAAAAAESGASGTGSTSSSSSQSGSSSSAKQSQSAADCPIQPSDYNSTYEFLGDTYRSKYNQFGYTIMDGGSGYLNTKLSGDAITYGVTTGAVLPPKFTIPFTVPPVNTVDDWDHIDGGGGPFGLTKNYASIDWSSNTFVLDPATFDGVGGSAQGLWVIWVSDDPGGAPKENENNYAVTKVNTDAFNLVRLINDTRYWDNGYTDAPHDWQKFNPDIPPGVTVLRGLTNNLNLHNPPGEESEVRFVNFALVEKSYEAWTDYDPNNGQGTAGTLRYPPGSGEFDALVIPNDEQIISTTRFRVAAKYPASQGYTGDNNTSTPPPGSSSNPSAPDDRTPDVPSIFVPPASEIEVHWNLQDGVLPANIGGSPKHANEDRTYLRISAPNVDWEVGYPAEVTRFTDSVSIVAKKLSEAKEELTWKPLEKGSDQPANIAIAYTNGEINVERLFRNNPDADAHCGSGAPFEFEYNNIEDNIQSLLGKSEGSFADDLHRVGISPNYYPLDIGADPFGRAWDNDGPEAKHFWSALAVSAVLLHSGMRPLRTQSALDYAMYGNEVDWRSWINVRKNDIAVFKFKGASGGHVGFIRSVDLAKNEVIIAGGNQSNSFKETGYRITSTDMYLLTVRRKWSDPGDDYKLL